MRLNGLGPSPSLFIQRHGQNNGQVNDTETHEVNHTQENKQVESSNSLDSPLEDPQVRAQVMELQIIEDKVIAHEQAHKAAGGEFTGAATYGYTVGPDGKRYITSGEVSISVPASDDPEQSLRALERVKAAALAPANPSGQDQSVAASASAKMMRLRSEIARQKAGEAYGNNEEQKTQVSGKNIEQDPHAPEHEHVDLIV